MKTSQRSLLLCTLGFIAALSGLWKAAVDPAPNLSPSSLAERASVASTTPWGHDELRLHKQAAVKPPAMEPPPGVKRLPTQRPFVEAPQRTDAPALPADLVLALGSGR